MANQHWKSAMQSEFDALINNTMTLVPLPPYRQVIGCKWVFKVKENPDISFDIFKDRLVAKGFHQRHEFDFKEISPLKLHINGLFNN